MSSAANTANNSINIKQEEGNFLYGDVIEDIIDAKIIKNELEFIEINIQLLVKWQKRSNGVVLRDSWVSSDILKIKDPKKLINFYESKIVFKQ